MKLILIEDREEEIIEQKLQDLSIFEPYHKEGYGLVITGDALTIIFKE
jgi:hypothetical protein